MLHVDELGHHYCQNISRRNMNKQGIRSDTVSGTTYRKWNTCNARLVRML